MGQKTGAWVARLLSWTQPVCFRLRLSGPCLSSKLWTQSQFPKSPDPRTQGRVSTPRLARVPHASKKIEVMLIRQTL